MNVDEVLEFNIFKIEKIIIQYVITIASMEEERMFVVHIVFYMRR